MQIMGNSLHDYLLYQIWLNNLGKNKVKTLQSMDCIYVQLIGFDISMIIENHKRN